MASISLSCQRFKQRSNVSYGESGYSNRILENKKSNNKKQKFAKIEIFESIQQDRQSDRYSKYNHG